MYGSIISVRSITYALKGEALLRRNGIPCKVVKTEGMENEGCKYGLSLSSSAVKYASELLSKNGIEISKIFS